jgi:hypothetical protein
MSRVSLQRPKMGKKVAWDLGGEERKGQGVSFMTE